MNNTQQAAATRPAPPDHLAKRVGGTVGEQFLAQGADIKKCIRQSLPPGYDFSGKRILDFGCGSGRVLRHFQEEAATASFYGCDIDQESIEYLGKELPMFEVAENGALPPLPYPDDHFDLVYCISVFTHLVESWEAWLLEMLRVTRPGGRVLATYLNKTAFEKTFGKPFDEAGTGLHPAFLDRPWSRGGPNAYLSHWWVQENWGRHFDIEAVFDEGMMNWQSIAVLRKPASAEAQRSRQTPPFIRPFVYGDYSADFLGNVEFNKFPAASWHDAHGVACDATCSVRGWFASRHAPIVDITFYYGERKLDAAIQRTQRKEVAQRLPDFHAPADGGFRADVDVSELPVGVHTLEAAATDGAGSTKRLQFSAVRR